MSKRELKIRLAASNCVVAGAVILMSPIAQGDTSSKFFGYTALVFGGAAILFCDFAFND